MIRSVFILLLLVLWHGAPAVAAPVVADLSNYHIDMDSSFNGTRLFLFGARNDNGDIVVVIRGPQKDYIVRKKEDIGGIWVNRERMKFFGVPDFYAVASNRPLSTVEQGGVFRQLGIGEENLLSPPTDPLSAISYGQFADAFLRHQREHKLYARTADTVNFMGETLFKTVLEFPDNIPPGNYTAEIYLVSDGEVAGMQSIPINVVKTGMDAALYAYAHDYPALYGITAVVLALAAGWFTGRLFEKM